MMKEMEERKNKIRRDKRVNSIGREISVRKHLGMVQSVVNELKEESRMRNQ